jgi:hypothetical protein
VHLFPSQTHIDISEPLSYLDKQTDAQRDAAACSYKFGTSDANTQFELVLDGEVSDKAAAVRHGSPGDKVHQGK